MLAQMHHGSVTIVSLSLHEDHDLGTRCHNFCATPNRGEDLYISISSKMRHRRKMSRAYLRRLSNAVVGMSPGLSLANDASAESLSKQLKQYFSTFFLRKRYDYRRWR